MPSAATLSSSYAISCVKASFGACPACEPLETQRISELTPEWKTQKRGAQAV